MTDFEKGCFKPIIANYIFLLPIVEMPYSGEELAKLIYDYYGRDNKRCVEVAKIIETEVHTVIRGRLNSRIRWK